MPFFVLCVLYRYFSLGPHFFHYVRCHKLLTFYYTLVNFFRPAPLYNEISEIGRRT